LKNYTDKEVENDIIDTSLFNNVESAYKLYYLTS